MLVSDPRDLVSTATRHLTHRLRHSPRYCLLFSSLPSSPLALLLLRRLQVPVRLVSKHADVIRLCRPHDKWAPPPLRLLVTSCHAPRARHLASRPSLVRRPSLDTHLTVYRTILPFSVGSFYISFALDPSLLSLALPRPLSYRIPNVAAFFQPCACYRTSALHLLLVITLNTEHLHTTPWSVAGSTA